MMTWAHLELNGGIVEAVDEFKYLGLFAESRSGVVGEVSCRIAQASRAIGSLVGDQEDGA